MVKKFLVLCICFFAVLSVSSQERTPIKLELSKSIGSAQEIIYYVIEPVFSHEGSTLAADSAAWNQSLNTFDAFGHVVITQSDGTTIRADFLHYNGNTRIADLKNNVQMRERNGAVLTTNSFTYNMLTKIGTYVNGGKIVNKEDVLTSRTGYYFVNSKDAYFRYNVEINTGRALVKADTMRYNTDAKIATFLGPTTIYSEEDTLHTDLGNYNTETRQAWGYRNNLYQQGSRTLRADTIFYDDSAGTGRVKSHIIFNDTEESTTIRGDIGTYSRADSVWITADTLQTRVIAMRDFQPVNLPQLRKNSELEVPGLAAPVPIPDTVRKPDAPDTLKRTTNTSKTRLIFAYHNVKIFKSDLQAVTDSISYSYADSIIRCYGRPMVWSQGTQLSADTIYMQMKESRLDNMILQRNGMIVSTEDSVRYDQIKGRTLTGIFANNKLSTLFVDGNAESIKHVDNSMNRTISSRIRMDFAGGKLVRVNLIGKVEGRLIPIEKVPEESKILQGFIWRPNDRPRSPEAIIPSLRD
jgi:lipopolysaccharide export system protein LptA